MQGARDGAGNPLHALHYAPYGEPFEATSTPQLPHGFTGEPTDPNGLVYLRARYYVPGLGVFPSLDTAERNVPHPAHLNLYAYVRGNPANRVDPTGHQDDCPPGIKPCGLTAPSVRITTYRGTVLEARAQFIRYSLIPSRQIVNAARYMQYFSPDLREFFGQATVDSFVPNSGSLLVAAGSDFDDINTIVRLTVSVDPSDPFYQYRRYVQFYAAYDSTAVSGEQIADALGGTEDYYLGLDLKKIEPPDAPAQNMGDSSPDPAEYDPCKKEENTWRYACGLYPIFRGMIEATDGLPVTGATARSLGARPDTDIPVQFGMVNPNTKGMSVSPGSPFNVPAHRRPPEFGGTGKDPVWCNDVLVLIPFGLQYRPDPDKPLTHGFVEPANHTTFDAYQNAVWATRTTWRKVNQ